MLEYCAELTRQARHTPLLLARRRRGSFRADARATQAGAARSAAPSRLTSSRDGFLFPRGWEEGEEAVAAHAQQAQMTQARGVAAAAEQTPARG